MPIEISPLAPASFPVLSPVRGARLISANCGIRYKNRPDLLLAVFDEGTSAAGVFTRSLASSAPVDWCRKNISGGKARALVVNSGNANAFTGKAGEIAVAETVKASALLAKCREEEVFVASTGVIGEALKYELIKAKLPELYASGSSADEWRGAAEAIMTTDTFPKLATRKAVIDGKEVTINGIAKGSGMIAPDMATMLAFVVTDAAVPPKLLQKFLSEANEESFNCITVDSDTSTSDTMMLFATGKAGNSTEEGGYADFAAKLKDLCLELAHLVVKDGEGATKFITVKVTGAETGQAAKRIGLAIANSPLVKTAIAGEDPNWGRIVMAVGKSGERADRDRLMIRIGKALVAKDGQVSPDYVEGPTAEYLKGRNIEIEVDAGVGNAGATIWTCDLTHAYIDINASYRS